MSRSTRIMSRRSLLTVPAALTFVAGASASAETDCALTVYFTRSGNTRVIASAIHRALGTQLFEIQPAQPYPEDYEETVERARLERDRGDEPALAGPLPDIAGCDTIFLGFPIWGETAPPLIRSFLSAYDLRNRTIRPFTTHGGYGPGNSLSVLASHAPGARIAPPFVKQAEQERRTLDQVRGWLIQIKGDTP